MDGTVAGNKGFQIQKENWGSNSKGKLASHPFWKKNIQTNQWNIAKQPPAPWNKSWKEFL